MNGIRLRLALLAVTLTFGISVAQAQGFTASLTSTVHLRAGPSIEYPLVTLVPAGAVAQVYGCEQGYGWCDVQIGPNRGWVDGYFLQTVGPGGPVIVASGGLTIGIPVVSFVLGSYWGSYYANRPWYGQRSRYMGYWNRYPHGRPPPPPRPPVHRPPARPPPGARPPPRPPSGGRPPGNSRPPPGNGKPPPSGGRPPGGGGGGRPPPGGKPNPPPNRPQGQPQ
jgi:uncharacterized protein YraI